MLIIINVSAARTVITPLRLIPTSPAHALQSSSMVALVDVVQRTYGDVQRLCFVPFLHHSVHYADDVNLTLLLQLLELELTITL